MLVTDLIYCAVDKVKFVIKISRSVSHRTYSGGRWARVKIFHCDYYLRDITMEPVSRTGGVKPVTAGDATSNLLLYLHLHRISTII